MTPAQARVLVAFLCTREADEVFYRYPPASDEEKDEAERIAAEGDRAYADAVAMGFDPDDYAQVLRDFFGWET